MSNRVRTLVWYISENSIISAPTNDNHLESRACGLSKLLHFGVVYSEFICDLDLKFDPISKRTQGYNSGCNNKYFIIYNSVKIFL